MNYTTVEQSKKLTELGLDPSTADMCWKRIFDEDHQMSDYRVELLPYKLYSGIGVPCWSVGRLIELMPYRILDNGVSKYLSIVKDKSDTFCITYYDNIIAAFEDIASACFKAIVWLIENHYINKQ